MAHLPWGHIRTILDKAATAEDRDWYVAAAILCSPSTSNSFAMWSSN
jgi:hypothetical protein